MPTNTPQSNTSRWYSSYYARQGDDRNDILRNRGVLFQKLAYDASLLRALSQSCPGGPSSNRVLDVGCGAGSSLLNFVAAGFGTDHLYGIDILEERVRRAHPQWPASKFVVGDASAMPIQSETFDIVFESTMFIQLTDEALACGVATEMIRVCRRGGMIVLADWRYRRPLNAEYRALSKSRVESLFRVGRDTDVRAVFQGALVPPVGRLLSKYSSATYFLLAWLLPFMVGQQVTVLMRRRVTE